jgi:hypothetical protein
MEGIKLGGEQLGAGMKEFLGDTERYFCWSSSFLLLRVVRSLFFDKVCFVWLEYALRCRLTTTVGGITMLALGIYAAKTGTGTLAWTILL